MNTSLLPRKDAKQLLECFFLASMPTDTALSTATRLVQCAFPYFSFLFPLAFVESQMAHVDGLRIVERGVLGSSLLCWGSFVAVFTFSFQSEDLEKSEVFPQSGQRRV